MGFVYFRSWCQIAPSNLGLLEIAQNKNLRNTAIAPWFVHSEVSRRDL